MSINVSQAFHRTSANPVDDTMALTKAQMLTVNDNLMPDYYFTICQDDGYIYLYDKSATASASTGKFKKFEGGGSGGGGTSEPTIINKTLTAAGWSNKQQTINFNGYDVDLGGVMGVPTNATAGQKEAYSEAIINVISQSGTSFTFSCENVPEIDLPVTLYAGGGGADGGGSAEYPEGGTTGQALVKKSNADNDVEWKTINSIPEGGTTGQVLAKHSATDKDVEWKTIDADKTQYTTMPTASADNLGQIVQYVGETTVTEPIYIKGLFYQCVSDGESTPTYSWEQADVQSYPETDLTNVFASGFPVASVSGDRQFEYSTGEQIVGTWIDGKPIYQKTFNLTSTVTTKDGSRILVDHNISNIKNAVNISGFITNSDVGTILIPQHFHNTSESQNELDFTVRISVQKIVYAIKTSLNIDSMYLTLQYTKTTD